MKSFDHINRRAHLYLGLFLLPWFVMYGVSSFVISHHAWFGAGQEPPWDVVSERPYEHAVPSRTDEAELRRLGVAILRETGAEGAFWAERPRPDELRIMRFTFWEQTRLTYLIAEKKLRTEHQRLRWDQVLLRMHVRGGFEQPGVLNTLWSIIVDIVCAAILVWIGSGIFMWWRLGRIRRWGLLALAGGLLSFALLMAGL